MTTDRFRVLLGEGCAEQRRLITALLEGFGLQVESAGDTEALSALLPGQADVIMIAADLPGAGAEPLVHHIRADMALQFTPLCIIAGGDDIERLSGCLAAGADDYLLKPLYPPLLQTRLRGLRERRRLRAAVASQWRHAVQLGHRFDELVKAVIPIGVTLLNERNFDRMLEAILLEAKRLAHADGGTLYLRTEDDHLKFVIVRNDSLGIALGGPGGGAIVFPPLPLSDPVTGLPNHRNVATHVAITGACISIDDAYTATGFEFSGTRTFDERTGYRSKSFLTVPLKNNDQRVIGVLQLLNAIDPADGSVVSFGAGSQTVVESLSVLAAAALESYAREEQLRRQIQELHIQIDQTRKEREVGEIAETDYFRDLQAKARALRGRS